MGPVPERPTTLAYTELLCLCCVEILKNRPVHSFNALQGLFTQLFFIISFLRRLPDTELKVTSSLVV